MTKCIYAPATSGVMAVAPGSFGLVLTTACIVAIVTLAGCQRHESAVQALKAKHSTSMFGDGSFSSEISGYNHTAHSISSFSVNGVWGGNALSYTGGGSSTCCLKLPLPWHPGLTVKISWEDENGKPFERDVPVPRYDEKSLGIFNVHFLRSGEIKVFAINAGLGHPDYPLQGEEAELKPGVPNYQYPRAPSGAN